MCAKEIIPMDWAHYEKVTYSPAVKKGNIIFISGQTGVDYHTGSVVGKGDVVAQARQAYENIKAILEKAGATFDDVVKITDYVTPEALPNYKATAKVRLEYLKKDFPASTGVVVNRLISSEFVIEIDVIAVLD